MRAEVLAISIYVLLFFVSCSNKGIDREKIRFDVESSLTLVEKINLDSTYLYYPTMVVNNDLCCIGDPTQRDFYFSLYTYPDFRFVRKFGAVGNGNGEIPMFVSFDLKQGKLLALSNTDNKIYVYELDSLSSKAQYTIDLNKNIILSSFCIGPDSTIFGNALTGPYQIVQINKDGLMVNSFLSLPKEDTMPGQLVNENWLSSLSFDSEDQTLVSAAMYGDDIDIIVLSEAEDPSIRRLAGKIESPRIFKTERAGFISYTQQYNTYISTIVNNNIYALFSLKDYSQDKDKIVENSIKVLDKNGTPLVKYMFDTQFEPSSFYVDEILGFAYVLFPEEEPQLWKYKI